MRRGEKKALLCRRIPTNKLEITNKIESRHFTGKIHQQILNHSMKDFRNSIHTVSDYHSTDYLLITRKEGIFIMEKSVCSHLNQMIKLNIANNEKNWYLWLLIWWQKNHHPIEYSCQMFNLHLITRKQLNKCKLRNIL